MTAKPNQNRAVVLRSPLAAKTAGGRLQMCEVVGHALVVFRGDIKNAQFAAAFEKAAGMALPDSFALSSAKDGRIAFRLGPDEWLLRDDRENKIAPEKTCAAFAKEIGDAHAMAINVSDYYAVIRIAGEEARDVLAAGCPLDLHPRVFAAGSFAQSRFAAAAILLHQRDDAPTYDVQTRWSFADYVWEYFRCAGGA